MKTYTSVVYDLTQFGIFKIKNAIVNADMDDGIAIEVSFDGGSTFRKIELLNRKFPVENSKGKIQVKIAFQDPAKADIYTVRTSGFFQNLEIGTTLNFTKKSTNQTYSTTVGSNGGYKLSLPRGIYSIWYKQSNGKKVELVPSFNPEMKISPELGLEKENTIELFLRGVEWAKYSVFDTFADPNKMLNGSTIITPDGNLSDGITDRKVRYWAIGFD